jgi:hypothetical protein
VCEKTKVFVVVLHCSSGLRFLDSCCLFSLCSFDFITYTSTVAELGSTDHIAISHQQITAAYILTPVTIQPW